MSLIHRRTLFGLLAALIVVSFLAPDVARAQTSCEDALRQAQNSYSLGLFEDVRPQLAPCITGRP